MKKTGNDPSKGTSFWGMVFSITLHVVVIAFILFWGFRGVSQFSGPSGPIQVSISSLDAGESGDAPAKKAQPRPKKPQPEKVEKKPEPPKVEKKEVKAPPEPPKEEPKKEEPEKEEVKKVEKKEEEPKKEPEKPKEEPKKEEKPKEVVKKEPEKKEEIPLEPEKKVEEKKEEPKKEEKKKEEKKVAEKPKPTKKPEPKKEKKKKLDNERSRVLKDIQRQKVLDQLGKSEEPDEPMGEEQRLAMADAEEAGLETTRETTSSLGSRNGGSSVNPVIVNLYSQQVHRKISRNWRIPPSVPTDGGLETQILFKVGKDGKIYDVRVSDSSGNPLFDEYCVNAIYKSAPLPPPPSELAKEAKDKGVVLTFRNDP